MMFHRSARRLAYSIMFALAVGLLFVILSIYLTSCGQGEGVPPKVEEGPTVPHSTPLGKVQFGKGWEVRIARFEDPENGAICYVALQTGISCIKGDR